MFRGPGEFDPYVRGIHSRALSLTLPTPSTIAGSLATYCISQLGKLTSPHQEWVNQYLNVLGNDVKIKGPVLSLDDELLIEDKCLNSLLSLDGLKEKCKNEYKRLKEVKGINELEEYLKLEKPRSKIKVERDVRIGVGLQVREEKMKLVKEEGGLYGAEYFDYRSFAKKKEEPTEILADIKGNLAKELFNRKAVIKLGGEGRISLMEFREGNLVFNKVKSEIWFNKQRHNGILALYLVTPALFKGGKKVEEYVKEWVKEQNYSFKGISGEVEPLGAGYALNEGKRKPIYTSLKSGSIVYLEGEIELLRAYWEFSFGEATQIGYGTLFPIPL
jgi:CRISPR type III-B/RAMP module-associated protein Cmr3